MLPQVSDGHSRAVSVVKRVGSGEISAGLGVISAVEIPLTKACQYLGIGAWIGFIDERQREFEAFHGAVCMV